jgi:hypothetical protein
MVHSAEKSVRLNGIQKYALAVELMAEDSKTVLKIGSLLTCVKLDQSPKNHNDSCGRFFQNRLIKISLDFENFARLYNQSKKKYR